MNTHIMNMALDKFGRSVIDKRSRRLQSESQDMIYRINRAVSTIQQQCTTMTKQFVDELKLVKKTIEDVKACVETQTKQQQQREDEIGPQKSDAILVEIGKVMDTLKFLNQRLTTELEKISG